jgi:hypothetical protein
MRYLSKLVAVIIPRRLGNSIAKAVIENFGRETSEMVELTDERSMQCEQDQH